MAGRVELAVIAKNQASAVLKQIGGDIAGLGKQSASVSQQLQGMGKAFTGIGGGLSAGVTAPLVGLGLSSINAAADMEQLDIAFTTMLGSASEAKALIQDLTKFSAQTPFEMPEVVAAGRQLLAFGIEAEDIETTLTQLGDVAAGVGAPIGDLAYLFGTASASGRLMTVDINQFAGRGIPIIEALGEVMGVSASQVRDLAAEGKIGAEEMKQAFALMSSSGGKFAGLMAAQSQSVKGLFSTVKDNVGQTLTVIGNQIIDTFDLKRVLGDAIGYLEQMRGTITDLAANNPALFKMAIGFGVVAAAVGPVVLGIGMAATAVGAALPVLAGLGGVLSGLALPFAALGAAAVALYYDVGGVRTGIVKLAGTVAAAMPTIQSMAGDAFTALQWIWEGKAANVDWWGDITDGLVGLGIIGQETGDSLAAALYDAGVTFDTIKGKITDGWLAVKDTVTVAVSGFVWSDFIESLTWDNVVTTTLDWGAYIAPLAWDGLLAALDWAAYVGQLTWDNAIVPALDWASYVAPLAWDAIVTTLGNWGAYVQPLAWSSVLTALDWGAYVAALSWDAIVTGLTDWGAYITVLDWAAVITTALDWASYITPLAWVGLVAALDWAAYIAPLAWDTIVTTLGDWGAYITSLDWTSIITTAIDWATWIPALSWAGFVTALEWSAYLAVFSWATFVSVLDWATVTGSGIDWTAFVSVLSWENLVTALDWVAYIGAFAWDSFVTKLEWTGTIAKLDNWSAFITDLSWSAYVAAIDWATVAPTLAWDAFVTPLGGWSTYIAQLSWSTYIDALGDWGQFVASIDWNAFVTGLSWTAFVSALAWSSFIPGFSWAAFVPRLQWPSIPSFPGWGALAQSLFGGGDAAATGATNTAPADSGGGVVDTILNSVGLATGARNYAGGWTWVGEQGRELMYVPAGADVYSKRESMGVLAQAGRYASAYDMEPAPVMVTQNITFHVNSEIDLQAAAYKLADIIRRRGR